MSNIHFQLTIDYHNNIITTVTFHNFIDAEIKKKQTIFAFYVITSSVITAVSS